jgi:hypothetical protein
MMNTADIRKFIAKAFLFSSPAIILALAYLIIDPFKVVHHYSSFYKSGMPSYGLINRDYASTTTFENNSPHISYNSFIFGNSRSLFYEVDDWKTHLSASAVCFHFDASMEGLYGIHRKVRYLDRRNVNLDNVLLVLDREILSQPRPGSGHLSIISPRLVDNENFMEFHLTFLKAFFNIRFLTAFIDFKLSGQIKQYMENERLLDDKPIDYDVKTNEMRFSSFEKDIREGRYYDPHRMSIFFKREGKLTFSDAVIQEKQKQLLTEIRETFQGHHTKYRIIISPLYDQKKLNRDDLEYLKRLFGPDCVFDFSGINDMTRDYRNYYEFSHYRPLIAKKIMTLIYEEGHEAYLDSYR